MGAHRVVLVVVVGAGALAAVTLPGSAAASASPIICGIVHGAHYDFKAPGSQQLLSGNRYRVTATGISCAIAKSQATHLTEARPGAQQRDGGRILSGGPTGWKCEGKSYTYSRRRPPTISGLCYKGSLTNPTGYFQWGIYGT